jgi:cytoskeleton-associated protein 5
MTPLAKPIPTPAKVEPPPERIPPPALYEEPYQNGSAETDEMGLIISNVLSHDSSRSVDALKKIQKILEVSPEAGPSNARYRELTEHTEGLIETITLQMNHVFETDILEAPNFRLAKHLIQTLNSFCDHPVLSESLSVDTLRGLLEELTLRLLVTDESPESKIKELSKFINMILLRLFATCRRVTIFR